jgi:pimeloyl-ACP methyl ester carboxylesterase
MANPTIVLVHGAFADASSWRALYDELVGDGNAILAPPNPLRSVAGDAAYTSSVLDQLEGPIILVGHSYGGAVITVAGDSDKVAALVFVSGFAPDQGESCNDMQARFAPPLLAKYIRPATVAGGVVEASVDHAGVHDAFCADLPAAEAAFIAVSQRPLAVAALDEKASVAAWRTKPSWGVLPTADNAISPDVHRFAYERMGAKVTTVEGASHVVMASQPAIVAGVIREAVSSCVPAAAV